MAKIRVYELAKELNMTNKALLNKIQELDIEVGSHMSSLEDDAVRAIREAVVGKKASENSRTRVRSTVIRRRKRVVDAPEETPPPPPVQEAPESTASEIVPDPAEATPSKDASEGDLPPVLPPQEKPVPKPPKRKKQTSEPARIIQRPQPPEPETPAVPDVPETPIASPTAETAAAPETPAVLETPASTETAETPADLPAVEAPEAEDAAETPEAKPADTDTQKKQKKKKKSTAAKIIKLPDSDTLELIRQEPPHTKPSQPSYDRDVHFTPDPMAMDPQMPPTGEDTRKRGKKSRRQGEGHADSRDRRRTPHRKKSVVEGKALYDAPSSKKGRRSGKHKAPAGQKTQITVPKAIKRRIKVDDTIVLAELAKRMGIKANEMIAKLMQLGVMATVNQTIDYDTAVLVASEFEFEVEKASFEEEIILAVEDDKPEELQTRPPVVTIMGHVDHGKTSLLDTIRRTKVVDGEAGGITQHIGAYRVDTPSGALVFLDTPGHEAFTAMRSRGAQVTDIVILVVAADDGVMPQTIEAINHSKAADVPIIVAVNKIDKPGAEPDRIKRELSEHGVQAEDWGGDTIFCEVSAKFNKGINELLEMVLLQAEVLDLKANPKKHARGHVVEAKLDTGRGPVATILIQEGTLRSGEPVVCGVHYGKIRAMLNDQGQQIDEAGPSTPVEILGFTGVPTAGDELIAVADEKAAKQVSNHRIQKQRAKELAKNSRISLEGLFEQMQEHEVKDLNLIIKADVQGSIEALKDSLSKLSTDEVKINVIHSATGTITESDVSLAAVSNAIILGFNVRPGAKVHDMATDEKVDMRFYDIIYNAIKDIKDAMLGYMESTFKEHVLGRADVKETFVIPKRGTIAGCMVTDGKIERGRQIRLLREGVIIFDGNLASLRRFKDDVKEVQTNYECGIGIENYNDIKVGDIIECYYMEEIKPTLE